MSILPPSVCVSHWKRTTELSPPLKEASAPRAFRQFARWLHMQKVAQSTSLAFNVAQSRCVPSLTVCHFEPKKWHTLPRVARSILSTFDNGGRSHWVGIDPNRFASHNTNGGSRPSSLDGIAEFLVGQRHATCWASDLHAADSRGQSVVVLLPCRAAGRRNHDQASRARQALVLRMLPTGEAGGAGCQVRPSCFRPIARLPLPGRAAAGHPCRFRERRFVVRLLRDCFG